MTLTRLMEEFPPVPTEQWEAAIAKDLKGADYAKKLIAQTPEGMALKPYYRAEDAADLVFTASAPGAFPFVRGAHPRGGWKIREQIAAADAAAANQSAIAAVTAGAEQIAFSGALVANASDLALLLNGLNEIPVHFDGASESLLEWLARRSSDRAASASLSAAWSPLANPEFAAHLATTAPAALTPFAVDAAVHEEAGATAVEEIAFALAEGIEVLATLEERHAKAALVAPRIEFHFAMGANYFFSIAKLRAFRMLWARAVESFGAPHSAAAALIHARTSRWNKTAYDPHVNVLRATTEAMAAVLGGANSLTVDPFDACYKQPDEASRRLARNTQILLKHEALLGHVADPGGGSYTIEVITSYLAAEAWKRMRQIEAAGGWRKALAAGLIADALKKSLAAREKEVTLRRRVLVGTNQFANPREHILDNIDPAQLDECNRGAYQYEALRLRTERAARRTGRTPKFLLAEFGDVKMRGARSNFALNFFACAGFEIAIERFKTAEEIAAREDDVVVLCSSDPEYAAMAAALIDALKAANRATPVVVAGNPENAAELEQLGVAGFIHIRSNPIEVLGGWQRRLGIED